VIYVTPEGGVNVVLEEILKSQFAQEYQKRKEDLERVNKRNRKRERKREREKEREKERKREREIERY
jgi:hypothetical protein